MSSLLRQLSEALPPHYEIERELASGGMGTVFLARDTVLDRTVAVKVHKPTAHKSAAQRLIQEARILARLNHPNVVSVHHAGSIGDASYYIMDYVEGETLRQRLSRGPLSTEKAVKLGDHVLAALEAAHEHGIVHRDVKPSNIFLVGDRALLGDFGIAKRTEQEATELTEPGHRVGTPGYMPPEQVASEEVTAATDLYAVGMVLYEALTGRRWSVVAAPEVADWSGVPNRIAGTLQRALEWSPGDRWSHAAAFRTALLEAGGQSRTLGRLSITSARAAQLGLILLAAIGGTWALWRVWPETSPPSSTRIAVLPFSVRGSGEFDYLGEGMVDLLSTKLDGAGELRSADPRAILSLVEREGAGALDPEGGRRIARGLGAGLYVLGNIVEVQGRLRLDASLYDPDRALDAVAQASAEGEAVRLFDLVDEVAGELLVGQKQGPGARMTRIAAVTTSSLPALKAYLEGEQAFRSGQFVPAAEAFQRAIEADSAFALAWYRLRVVADWLVRSDLVERSAEQAVRHSGRLSEHDRQLLEASLAARRGDAVEAERQYRSILETYPDDVEAWYQLAEVIFHFGPFFGRSPAESREAFQRVLVFEPSEVHALTHLIRLASREADPAALDGLVDRFIDANPDADRALEIRALREFALGDEQSQRRVLDELALASADVLLVTVWSVPTFTGDMAAGEDIAAALVEPLHSPEVRALGHILLAELKAAQGRWSEAKAELDSAAPLDAATALEHRAVLIAAPFLPIPRVELEAVRAQLRDWDASTVRPSAAPSTWVNVHDGAHSHLRLYLLGLLSARLDEYGVALRYAQELALLEGSEAVTELASDLARGIRAQVAYAQGGREEALVALEATRMKTWYQRMASSPFYSQAYERYTRASLLAESGREQEALIWLGSFAESSLGDRVFLAPSHLRRGEIYDRLGETDKAAEHYRRFLELWRDSDPEFRPMLEHAEDRFAELTGQEYRRSD